MSNLFLDSFDRKLSTFFSKIIPPLGKRLYPLGSPEYWEVLVFRIKFLSFFTKIIGVVVVVLTVTLLPIQFPIILLFILPFSPIFLSFLANKISKLSKENPDSVNISKKNLWEILILSLILSSAIWIGFGIMAERVW